MITAELVKNPYEKKAKETRGLWIHRDAFKNLVIPRVSRKYTRTCDQSFPGSIIDENYTELLNRTTRGKKFTIYLHTTRESGSLFFNRSNRSDDGPSHYQLVYVIAVFFFSFRERAYSCKTSFTLVRFGRRRYSILFFMAWRHNDFFLFNRCTSFIYFGKRILLKRIRSRKE